MKKLMLLTSAAALMLASCSEDELKEVSKGRAIDFQALAASRAVETTGLNLNSFYASAFTEDGVGYNDFAAVEFAKDGGYYESVKKYYWPSDGSTLYFSAYAPAADSFEGTVSLAKESVTLTDYTPAYNIGDQVDFVYATGQGTSADEVQGVKLTFQHALAQIEIRAKNENALTYKVAGVKISSVATSGTFNNTTGWTEGGTMDTYKALYDNAIVLNGDAVTLMGDGGNAMLVPQQLDAWNPTNTDNSNQGSFIAVKVNVKDASGTLLYPKMKDATNTDAYGWVAVPIDTKWEAGMKYVYTLDFSTGAGAVAPAVPNAGDTNGGDENVPDDEKNPAGDDEEEAPKPGDPSLGSPIHFTVEVTPWTSLTETPNMTF